ncbi:MAG TPA: dipeptide ABC transporter ATP-binding protein [Myxococcales bacterium]|nr:dipeptide ABC transporter ATP-binding protein [Myxococcales bacterium]HIN85567.1 dipeptide ABC transporter ATP-binding protein [Myxococcales bacterium]
MTQPLIRVSGLKVHFPLTRGVIMERQIGSVKAVDGIDLNIMEGETLGLVGESGCGKSTTGRAILQLTRPTAGSIKYRDIELTELSGEALRKMRRKIQIIFQDPYASLNPRMTVEQIIGEPVSEHGMARGKELKTRVYELMEMVGLDPEYIKRYPHEFSGGQRQRIGIARALALKPEFLVCDEPVSALDVSVQAQVLNLLKSLQQEFKLTYLFVAHDLAVVRHLSTRIAVMYLGRIVELGESEEICRAPKHPYTQALISAIPIPDPVEEAQRRRILLDGDVPSPLNPPSGCAFHTRCQFATEQCKVETPQLREYAPGHTAACLRLDELSSQIETGNERTTR